MGNEDDILKTIEGSTIEETTTNIITWFMFNDVANNPKASSRFESRNVTTVSAKPQKGLKKRSQGSEEKQKIISVESTQEEEKYMP